MTKLKTIMVDDEPLALDLLRSYLRRRDDIEIIAECKNGKEAIEQITELQPDLLFLDIQMPGFTGFDVIKRLQPELLPMVVFVTAYDQYALDAFDVHAVDYLLKPLDEDLLKRSIERCLERHQQSDANSGIKRQIIGAVNQIESHSSGDSEHTSQVRLSDHALPKLIIRDRGAITFVEQLDIDWVDAAGDYMCVHANGETHIIRSTLKNLVSQLNAGIFQRIHRSTIVNLQRVEKIIPLPKSEYFLVLNGGERLKVSRNYKNVVKDLIVQYEQANS